MANNANALSAKVLQELPQGFVEMSPVGMNLNIESLRKMVNSRIDYLRKTMGFHDAEKLANFCNNCAQNDVETLWVQVIAKKVVTPKITQFLFLWPCGEAIQQFQINSAFFVGTGKSFDGKANFVSGSQQNNVAYATR